MAADRHDASPDDRTGWPRWERISEAEARAALGNDVFDEMLVEITAMGRESAARYRAAGWPVIDQT
jgi:hypothetical protein